MLILAVDPGPEQSGYVLYSTDGARVIDMGIVPNIDIMFVIDDRRIDEMVIEMVASYGMAVGASVFMTCVWIGRFIEHFSSRSTLLYRKQRNEDGMDSVCMHLCKNNRAKDSNIRQALIDKFPPTGGGKVPQIGTKKQPGPLYGVKEHMWSALALAVTYSEQITCEAMGETT